MITATSNVQQRSPSGRRHACAAIAGLLWALGLLSPAFGQQGEPGVPGSSEPQQGRQLIETIRIWKMTEALNLDEGQAAKLFPRLAQLEASRRAFHNRQRVLRDELAVLLKQRPLPDKEIKARLEQLDRAETDFRGREQAIKGGLRSILTMEQQARLALFEDRFDTELRLVIQDLRQRRRGPHPPPSVNVQSPPAMGGPSVTPVEGGLPPR